MSRGSGAEGDGGRGTEDKEKGTVLCLLSPGELSPVSFLSPRIPRPQESIHESAGVQKQLSPLLEVSLTLGKVLSYH